MFSGKHGNYREDDVCDPEDLYGRTKLLGEVSGAGCLTLRTSIVGRELVRRTSLLEWFLGRRGERVSGFARALYTGFSTQTLARLVGHILQSHPQLDGLWHVASEPISKYDLLVLANEAFGAGVEIEKNHSFFCDRRLDGSRFCHATGFEPPPWKEMLGEIARDPTPYRKS